MDIDLSEIEQSLVLVYQKNLNFLKENFFDIFEKVNNFSIDLESNKIQEKYSLELKDGYFDILNLENNGYYYGINSYVDAELRVQNTDFTDNSSLDLLRKVNNSKKLSVSSFLTEILPVVNFINNKVDLENIEFQKIMKFAFIGVGLGIHIQEIEKKIKPYTTLIIEPELEIFRLSLFTLDYTIFKEGGRTLFLSIGDEKMEREKVFSNFFNYHSYMNYNIKHYTLLENLDYIKTHLFEFCEINYAGSFPYKLVIENVQRTIRFIRDEDRFLIINGIIDKKPFKNRDVLLISAGPSLDNYIELIKKYQDKFIITCVDVSVRKLEKHGIVPDVIFSIDPQDRHAEFLKTREPKYLENSAIILLSQQHSDVMQLLRERKLKYYFSQFDKINSEIGSLGSVPNVGTFSFHVMAHMGTGKMYTIGNDASFHQETGLRYSIDSHLKIDIMNSNTKSSSISKTDILEVKGNLRKTVKTNRELNSFKLHYDQIINYINTYIKFEAYNLSDGAYIDGLTPMTKEEFISEAETIVPQNKDVVNIFDNISKTLEVDCYENDIKIINSIIQKTKKFQKQKIISKNDFLTKKLDTMLWIIEKSKEQSIGLFGNIFLHYTDLVDSYINFTINLKQKDLHTQLNLELLRDHWANGVIAVFKDMKDALLDEINEIAVYVEKKKIDTITRYIFKTENGRIFNAGKRRIMYDVPNIYQNKINQVTFKDATNNNTVSSKFVAVIKRNDERYSELSFKRSLVEDIDEGKIKDLYCKNAIGFLAVQENLENEDFVTYIKELYIRFPQVTFKAFYFNDEQKKLVGSIFHNEKDRFVLVTPLDIYHFNKEMEIFIWSTLSSLDLKIAKLLLGIKCSVHLSYNFFTGSYKITEDSTLSEYDALHKNTDIIKYKDSLDFTKNEIIEYGDSFINLFYQSQYNKIENLNYNIDMNMKTLEFLCFKNIEITLNYPILKILMFQLNKLLSVFSK